jgi:hypothetical protein
VDCAAFEGDATLDLFRLFGLVVLVFRVVLLPDFVFPHLLCLRVIFAEALHGAFGAFGLVKAFVEGFVKRLVVGTALVKGFVKGLVVGALGIALFKGLAETWLGGVTKGLAKTWVGGFGDGFSRGLGDLGDLGGGLVKLALPLGFFERGSSELGESSETLRRGLETWFCFRFEGCPDM